MGVTTIYWEEGGVRGEGGGGGGEERRVCIAGSRAWLIEHTVGL